MSQTKLVVEVLDSTNTWQDVTADVMHITIDGLGLTGPRGTHSRVAHCRIKFKNTAKTYNPDVSSYVSALLECRRRIRVRASGASLGKAAQLQQNRMVGGLDQGGFRQNVSVSYSPGDVFTLTYQARAQFDSQYNTDRSILEVMGGAIAANAFNSYTNKWQSYSLTGTASGSNSTLTVRFDITLPIGAASNAKTIEYKNISLTKNGGANLLTNGNFSNGFSPWTTYQTTGTTTAAVIDDYWIIFNGIIESISPSPFASAGQMTSDVLCVDFTEILRLQNIDLPLQKNQTGDQLNTTVLKQLSSYLNVILLDKPTRYYRLDEASGTVAADSSGNGQNGTYSGTVTYSATGALIGDSDTAITFNGTTTQVSLSSPTLTNASFTVEAWVQMTALPASRMSIFASYNANSVHNAISLEVTSTGNLKLSFKGDDQTSAGTLATGKYYHVAAVYNYITNTTTLYINGASDSSGSHGPLSATPTTTYIGNDPAGSAFWNGQIDEVAVYTRALSATDIARHYNAGIGKYNVARLPGILQSVGRQTFSRAFDGYTKTKVSILDAVSNSADSEFGIQWIDRDGTFRWAARDFLPGRVLSAPALTLSDGMAFTMQVARATDTVRNTVNLAYRPRQTVTSSVIILGQSTATIEIPPVQPGGIPGSNTVALTFRDPASGQLIGGDTVITPLVASTDFTINDQPDGSGTDYTTNALFAFGAIQVSASQITIELKNWANRTLYATKLQSRGYGVYTYDPITISAIDADSIMTYQGRTWDKVMPFNNDGNFAASLATYLIGRYKQPFEEVAQLSASYKATLNGVDLLSLELMDVISLSDTELGMTAIKHLIIGVNYDLMPHAGDYVGGVTFLLERLDQTTYWVLGSSTYGQLDVTTDLYI